MSARSGKAGSSLHDPSVQSLPAARLAAARAEAIAALLERLRGSAGTFHHERAANANGGLAAFPITTGADLAAEVAAHPPFGRLQLSASQPIRAGLAAAALPHPVPICWTQADLDFEAALGARALWRAGLRPRQRSSDCLDGGLVTPGTLAVIDALDALDAVALPVGLLTCEAAWQRAREMWAVVPPEVLIANAASFRFLETADACLDCTVALLLTPADATLLAAPPRDGLYRILSVPQASTFLAGECAAHAGLHVAEDAVAVEIVDPESVRPLPDGSAGLVLVSTLRRSAALLRFSTGLRGALDRTPCACGEIHARLVLQADAAARRSEG